MTSNQLDWKGDAHPDEKSETAQAFTAESAC
jgi:hypothetical protein